MPTPYRYLRCGDLRSPWVTERRNGPLGLHNNDDDDYINALEYCIGVRQPVSTSSALVGQCTSILIG